MVYRYIGIHGVSKEESPHEVLLQTTEGNIIRVVTPTMSLMLATVQSYATKATPYVLARTTSCTTYYHAMAQPAGIGYIADKTIHHLHHRCLTLYVSMY